MSVVLDNLPEFLSGLRVTAELTILSFLVALVLGIVVAGFRVSPVPPLRWVGTAYVELIRNTPLAVLFLLFYFGLPKVGLNFSVFTWAVLILATYTGTFVTETVRSGINSVSVGQAEAGRALGLTFLQLLFVVVIPQALRSVVGPLGSVFIALIKNSGVAALIAAPELAHLTERLSGTTERPVAVYVGAAIGYLLLALPSGWAVGVLARRVAIKR